MTDPIWLFFVEDPGALNYFLPLIKYAVNHHISHVLVAESYAFGYFSDHSIPAITKEQFQQSSINYSYCLVGTSENPHSFAFALIEISKNLGIPTASIVDSSINCTHRFRGSTTNPLKYIPDYLFVPDLVSHNSFYKLGVSASSIQEVGYPITPKIALARCTSKEKVRQSLGLSLPPGRPLITFISEISTGLDPIQYQLSMDYTLFGVSNSKSRTIIVIEELFNAIESCCTLSSFSYPCMAIRLHPKETTYDLATYPSSFDYISKIPADAYELIIASDLVIGMSSMLLNESLWLGANCLSIVPREVERNWLPTVSSGDIPCVYQRENLINLINQFFSDFTSPTQRKLPSNSFGNYKEFCPSSIFDSPFTI